MVRLKRDIKKEVIALQGMMKQVDMTEKNKEDIMNKIFKLQSELLETVIKSSSSDGDVVTLDLEEVIKRREFLGLNAKLKEIFKFFWYTFRTYANNNDELSRDGYMKFNISIQRAIVGNQLSDDDVEFNAEVDWEHDLRVYGAIDESTFYDVLFELIENAVDFADPLYYTAFAWTLLNAIADTSQMPPRLKAKREIPCIMKTSSETQMINDYVNMKETRDALTVNEEFMAEFREAQARHAGRKRGLKGDDDDTTDMLELFAMKWAKANTGTNYNTDTDDDSDVEGGSDDSDDSAEGRRKGRRKNKKEEKKNKNKIDFEEKWKQSRMTREAYEREADEKRKAVQKEFEGRSNWILSQGALGEGADVYYDYDPGVVGGFTMKRGKYFSHMLDKSALNVDAYYSNDNPYEEGSSKESGRNSRGFVVSSRGDSQGNMRQKPLSFAQKLARKKEQLMKKLAREAALEAQKGLESSEVKEGVDSDIGAAGEGVDSDTGAVRESEDGVNPAENAVDNSMEASRVSRRNDGASLAEDPTSSEMRDPSKSGVSFAMITQNQLSYTQDNVIEFHPEPKGRSFTSWVAAQQINKNRAYNRVTSDHLDSGGIPGGRPHDPAANGRIRVRGSRHTDRKDGLYHGAGSGSPLQGLGVEGTLKTILLEAVPSVKKGRKSPKKVTDGTRSPYAGVGTPSRNISTDKLLFHRADSDSDNSTKNRLKSPYPTPINIETHDAYSSEEEEITSVNKALLTHDNILKLVSEARDFYASNSDYVTHFPHDLYSDIVQQNNESRDAPPSRGYVWNHARATKSMKSSGVTGVVRQSPIKKKDNSQQQQQQQQQQKSPLKPLAVASKVKVSLNMPRTIPPLNYDSYWGKKHVHAELAPDTQLYAHYYPPAAVNTTVTEKQVAREEVGMDDDITVSPSTSPRAPMKPSNHGYKIVASTKVIRNIHDPSSLPASPGDGDSVTSYNTEDTRVNKYQSNSVALAIRNIKGVLAHVNQEKQPCLAELVVERKIIYEQPNNPVRGPVRGDRSIAESSSMDSVGDNMSYNSVASSITASHAGFSRKKKPTKLNATRSYGEFNESMYLRRQHVGDDNQSGMDDTLNSSRSGNTMTIRSLDTITTSATGSTQAPWCQESSHANFANRKNEMFLGFKEKNEINQLIPNGYNTRMIIKNQSKYMKNALESYGKAENRPQILNNMYSSMPLEIAVPKKTQKNKNVFITST